MALSKVLQEALSYIPQGYLFGLTMSTAGASTTLTVNAGMACDSTGVRMMKLVTTMSKTTSAWAAGSAAGGLDTGAIAASTWYHWFLIQNPATGAVDIVFSATATPANGPTTLPSGYTLFRRIGSMKTNGSSQWVSFVQVDDEFTLVTAINELNVNPTSSAAITRTLASVPTGVVVTAIIGVFAQDSASPPNNSAFIYPMDTTTTVNTNFGMNSSGLAATVSFSSYTRIRTNTSAQIQTKMASAAATVLFRIDTWGWVDTRGKLS